jgi:hypothetical protein
MGALLPAVDDRLKALILISPGFYAIAELERLQARRKEGSTIANTGNISKQSQEDL